MTTFTLRRELSKLLEVPQESSFPFFRVTIATTNWVSEFSEDGEQEPEYTEQVNTDQLATETMLLATWALLEKQGMTIKRYLYNTRGCAGATISSVMNVRAMSFTLILN